MKKTTNCWKINSTSYQFSKEEVMKALCAVHMIEPQITDEVVFEMDEYEQRVFITVRTPVPMEIDENSN